MKLVSVSFALIAATACSAFAVDPCALDFKLLASRRFMLDNEVPLSEFVPGDVMRSSPQNSPHVPSTRQGSNKPSTR